MVRRRAERVIRPTRAKTRRGQGPLAQTNPCRPRLCASTASQAPLAEARRRHQPDAVLDLDLGVAAMIGLQFQRLRASRSVMKA